MDERMLLVDNDRPRLCRKHICSHVTSRKKFISTGIFSKGGISNPGDKFPGFDYPANLRNLINYHPCNCLIRVGREENKRTFW
ncbi:MAG: hypothetical protein BWY93_01942 [Euryarchaeota archaeon ADurb.BinA087]|nr:MAG: hypothetical protein BWY93_01942 [Euryarchaeota archaeon ADurb.BinA087]